MSQINLTKCDVCSKTENRSEGALGAYSLPSGWYRLHQGDVFDGLDMCSLECVNKYLANVQAEIPLRLSAK